MLACLLGSSQMIFTPTAYTPLGPALHLPGAEREKDCERGEREEGGHGEAGPQPAAH